MRATKSESIYPMHNTKKVIFLGKNTVGKTSIIRRMVDNSYSDQVVPTIGCGTATLYQVVDNSEVGITLWDTAGQEKYATLTQLYLRGADVIVIVSDATKEKEKILEEFAEYEERISHIVDEDTYKMIYVVNKVDAGEIRYLDEYPETIFTSAKSNENIDGLLMIFAREALKINKSKKENIIYPGELEEKKCKCLIY